MSAIFTIYELILLSIDYSPSWRNNSQKEQILWELLWLFWDFLKISADFSKKREQEEFQKSQRTLSETNPCQISWVFLAIHCLFEILPICVEISRGLRPKFMWHTSHTFCALNIQLAHVLFLTIIYMKIYFFHADLLDLSKWYLQLTFHSYQFLILKNNKNSDVVCCGQSIK